MWIKTKDSIVNTDYITEFVKQNAGAPPFPEYLITIYFENGIERTLKYPSEDKRDSAYNALFKMLQQD